MTKIIVYVYELVPETYSIVASLDQCEIYKSRPLVLGQIRSGLSKKNVGYSTQYGCMTALSRLIAEPLIHSTQGVCPTLSLIRSSEPLAHDASLASRGKHPGAIM